MIYQGAFGARSIGAPPGMSADTVFSIASMTKLLTSVAALQLVERDKTQTGRAGGKTIDPTLGSPQVLDGFDAQGRRNCAPRESPSRCAICSRTRPGSAISSGTRMSFATARRRQQSGAAACAADVRSGRQMGLWRQPRPGRPAGGNRQRANSDRYFRDHILGPLGMNDTAFTLTESQRARQASLHLRKADGTLAPQPLARRAEPKVFSGGRRHLFNRAGLSDLASGAAEWRRACREQHPAAADGGADVHQPDRQPRCRNSQDDKSGIVRRTSISSRASGCGGALAT